MADIYDRDYFEYGVQTSKSNYSLYRWLCEDTLSMAMAMIDFLDIKKDQAILDFGCGKGFLVKAFRLLHRQAWGCDISKYAIENADPAVKECCLLSSDIGKRLLNWGFDFCIAKDTFEHIPADELRTILEKFNIDTLFVIVPLGTAGKYVAPANDLDITHVICEPEDWWTGFFKSCGWELKDFRFRIDGIKDSYYKKWPNSHGFFTLNRRSKI